MCNGPAICQRIATSVFAEILHEACELFIDDIIVHNSGEGYEEVELHFKFLLIVFKCLERSNLKLHPEKCKFFERSVKYLGEIIENGTVRPDPKKLNVVSRLAPAKTVSELRHVLGILGVHRTYIKDFSRIAEPLTRLLSVKENEVGEKWGTEQQEALETLQAAVVNAEPLFLPRYDPGCPFVLYTDWSKVGKGAVLC